MTTSTSATCRGEVHTMQSSCRVGLYERPGGTFLAAPSVSPPRHDEARDELRNAVPVLGVLVGERHREPALFKVDLDREQRERNGDKIYQIFAESVQFNTDLTDELFSLTGVTRKK